MTLPASSLSRHDYSQPPPHVSRLARLGRREPASALRLRGLADEVERLDDLGEMTGAGMALTAIDEGRLLLGADLLRLPAARAEPAAGRRVRRRRHVALEHDPLPLPALARLLDRHRRQERLR